MIMRIFQFKLFTR